MNDSNQTASRLTPNELDRFIHHLRDRDQTFVKSIGNWRREVRTDACLAADYLEALRAELPHWQPEPVNDE